MIRFFGTLFILLFVSSAFAKPINIIAAENFYGDIAQEIGASHVNVTSILNNPNQDPHLFSARPSVARAIAAGNIIIYNGIGYDPWIQTLLPENGPQVIVVAQLVGAKDGDNPHLWYKPETAGLLAKTLLQQLIQDDPAHKQDYQQNYNRFNQRYQAYLARIADVKKQYQGTGVIATESVFNYMAQALGLVMYGQGFQTSILNDISPSPAQIEEFENAIKSHQAHLLIYNDQVINPVTARMKALALANHLPVVGVYETEPTGTDFLSWMNETLTVVSDALKSEAANGST